MNGKFFNEKTSHFLALWIWVYNARIEITVTNPGEAPITSNIKVQQSDLELLEELKEMGR